MAPKLIRNAVRCKRCDTTVESRSRHDFQTCPCGAVSVDGGLAYTKRAWDARLGGPETVFEDLTEYVGNE